jgi:hypothetical protein
MQLKIDQDLFDRMMKLAKELGIPYRKIACEAMKIGIEVLWHKYYTDARVVVLHTKGRKEVEFCEIKTDVKEKFDDSSSEAEE